jgi:hypothetical protein
VLLGPGATDDDGGRQLFQAHLSPRRGCSRQFVCRYRARPSEMSWMVTVLVSSSGGQRRAVAVGAAERRHLRCVRDGGDHALVDVVALARSP